MAPTSDFDLEMEGSGADDGGLHVRILERSDDEGGLVGGGGVESGISYVILEN